MPARPKAFLKQAKGKQKKEQRLETVDDFQAAGVDLEDAAGKWRAGDAVKSMRFFQRALEVYEQGLQNFPQSLDLAYNKARVQLEVATHPILVKQLQQPILDALGSALESHRYALSLDQDNADTVFNTSQVLTSIAEEIAKDDNRSDSEALQALQEALELQNRCLSLQEFRFGESQQQEADEHGPTDTPTAADSSDDEEGGADLNTASTTTTTTREEQWFSIVEPITEDVLIDTILAQLNTLTSLCRILSSSPDLAPSTTLVWVEEYSSKLLGSKLPMYSQSNPNQMARVSEIALTKVNFTAAILEAGFRSLNLDLETYKRELDAAYSATSNPDLSLATNPEALESQVRSLVAMNSAITDVIAIRINNNTDNTVAAAPTTITTAVNTRWTVLTTALNTLTTLSKLLSSSPPSSVSAEVMSIPQTHLQRGDVSLLQYQLSIPLSSVGVNTTHPSAVNNQKQLLKNAQVFYRNAARLLPSSPDNKQEEEEKWIAMLRCAIAQHLLSNNQNETNNVGFSNNDKTEEEITRIKGREWTRKQIEEMVVDGLITATATATV